MAHAAVSTAIDWAKEHGLVMFGRDGQLANAPFSLRPAFVDRSQLTQVIRLQSLWNRFVAVLAASPEFLKSTHTDVIQHDPFTAALVTMLDLPRCQRVHAGVFRTDYMLHQESSIQSLRNVEINCIAAAFPALSSLTTSLHTALSESFQDQPTPIQNPSWTAVTWSIALMASSNAIAAAAVRRAAAAPAESGWAEFAPVRLGVAVITAVERNAIDIRYVESYISAALERCAGPLTAPSVSSDEAIPPSRRTWVVRVTLETVLRYGVMVDSDGQRLGDESLLQHLVCGGGKEAHLLLPAEWAPTLANQPPVPIFQPASTTPRSGYVVVSLAYFRTAYDPDNYKLTSSYEEDKTLLSTSGLAHTVSSLGLFPFGCYVGGDDDDRDDDAHGHPNASASSRVDVKSLLSGQFGAGWVARAALEVSSCISCPSVAVQLVGTKRVQQVISDAGVAQRIMQCCASMGGPIGAATCAALAAAGSSQGEPPGGASGDGHAPDSASSDTPTAHDELSALEHQEQLPVGPIANAVQLLHAARGVAAVGACLNGVQEAYRGQFTAADADADAAASPSLPSHSATNTLDYASLHEWPSSPDAAQAALSDYGHIVMEQFSLADALMEWLQVLEAGTAASAAAATTATATTDTAGGTAPRPAVDDSRWSAVCSRLASGRWVLKPQREGGGHLVGPNAVADFISKVTAAVEVARGLLSSRQADDVRHPGADDGDAVSHAASAVADATTYIAMRCIDSPTPDGALVLAGGKVEDCAVVSEFGVYGAMMMCTPRAGVSSSSAMRSPSTSASGAGVSTAADMYALDVHAIQGLQLVYDVTCGHLCRTKSSVHADGGVAAGVATLDSITVKR